MAGTIVLGTFDLRDLCTCPDPCPDCCITQCGCSNIPATLYATFDGCINQSVPITYDSGTQHWLGTGTFTCGDNYSIDFHCNNPMAPNWQFQLLCVNSGTTCINSNIVSGLVSCSPFLFTQHIGAFVNCFCCPGGSFVNLTLTA